MHNTSTLDKSCDAPPFQGLSQLLELLLFRSADQNVGTLYFGTNQNFLISSKPYNAKPQTGRTVAILYCLGLNKRNLLRILCDKTAVPPYVAYDL